MTNRFKLALPENGFGYPCNICANRNQPVSSCKDCTGYEGTFDVDQSDLRNMMEGRESKLGVTGEESS